MFFVALSSLFVCVFSFARGPSVAGTTTFVFDGNRMYAELGFVRPDGSIHRALAFVDMGSPSMTLTESLFKELQLDKNHPLRFRVGDLLVEVPRAEVITEPGEPYSMGPDLKVEGMLPAGILQRYQVVIDTRIGSWPSLNPKRSNLQALASHFISTGKRALSLSTLPLPASHIR